MTYLLLETLRLNLLRELCFRRARALFELGLVYEAKWCCMSSRVSYVVEYITVNGGLTKAQGTYERAYVNAGSVITWNKDHWGCLTQYESDKIVLADLGGRIEKRAKDAIVKVGRSERLAQFIVSDKVDNILDRPKEYTAQHDSRPR
ncbi:hypothetical protein PG993_014795 [Apiospora rasikravindrae]|uniref:Uncharacterized protein n=1 Tax=Apiospora rasikravindrae TaxID=990691 RepID=A0ABR1RNS3_9PEZI